MFATDERVGSNSARIVANGDREMKFEQILHAVAWQDIKCFDINGMTQQQALTSAFLLARKSSRPKKMHACLPFGGPDFHLPPWE